MVGRQILDVVLIANEVIDKMVFREREGVLCKLDMEKNYNHVSWEFVNYMLGRLGYGLKWRGGWVRASMTFASFTVIVNDRASTFFQASRGLRQGDPLLSLLFIIVMESLNSVN